jgi:hypothetical protein
VLYWQLLPLVLGDRPPPTGNPTSREWADYLRPAVPRYVSPADPSLALGPQPGGADRTRCSYAANYLEPFRGLVTPAGGEAVGDF